MDQVFQLIKDPKFDFMSRGRLFISMSLVLVLASVAVLVVNGLNLGIEFSGGTELQLKYVDHVEESDIRSALADAGLTSQVVTTIGDPADNEIYIRLGSGSEGQDDAELTTKVTKILRAGADQPRKTDLNVADRPTLTELLDKVATLAPGQASTLAEAITTRRKDQAIFSSLEELSSIPGMTPDVMGLLQEQAYIGPVALRSQSYIYPAVGEELLDKAKLAVTLSLIMMLIYIWIRFQLQWGFAAVLALAHDTVLTLGLFSLFDMEMTLPVIAAFLTLVGYSVNDTVVVFDRIRENIRNRSSSSFQATVNLAINQTLGRTIITSGLTWIVVFGLYLFGGPALHSFAFVLSVGVVVGTYSSIYIASPLLLFWDQYKASKREAGEAPPTTARRVRKA